MRIFKDLVGRLPCSAVKPLQMLAVIFMGFAAAITMQPQSTNLLPSAGSGSEQAFVATFTDPNGVLNVQSLSIAIVNNAAPNIESGLPGNGCVVNFMVSSGIIRQGGGKAKDGSATRAVKLLG